uniref:Uncharacterized protein n=1 Tax=viral metagenome TaxID=1070528 RepID=A0A6C0F0X9_9ZZZZ
MDLFTVSFWVFYLVFIVLSVYLVSYKKVDEVLYLQIASGVGMFVTSKIGRTFLGIAQ